MDGRIEFRIYLDKAKTDFDRSYASVVKPSTNLTDYEFLETVGRGAFGRVLMAEEKTSKDKVAVKVVDKKILSSNQGMLHLVSEIKLSMCVRFEFVLSVKCYFTDPCRVFIVGPFVGGGNLFSALRTKTRLTEDVARFYAGQVFAPFWTLPYLFHDFLKINLIWPKTETSQEAHSFS